MNAASPDLSNLPRFLEHLDARDRESAQFARRLIDAGGIVRSFWGPEQMDVWELLVQRGEMIVRFGVERGFSDGVLIVRAETPVRWDHLRWMPLVMVAWARANEVPLPLEDPDEFDVDLVSHGLAALDWAGEGHDDAVERVWHAWYDYRQQVGRLRERARGRPAPSDIQAVKAAGVAAIEAAAAMAR